MTRKCPSEHRSRGERKTHVFVRPMWEHRRLVVVHAFIRKVVVDYLNELYKFLSSTKHAFVTYEKSKVVVNCVSF